MKNTTLEVDSYFKKISHFIVHWGFLTFLRLCMDLVEDHTRSFHSEYFVAELLVKVSFIDCVDVQNVTCKWRKYMQARF